MTWASGTRLNGGWAVLLALVLALLGGIARAESYPAAAWAFDLLARVEQWRPTGPLDFLPGAAKDQPVPTAAQARIQAGYGRLPMHFEPNLGQVADEVKFVARGPGYTLFLTADEAVLALRPSRPALDRADLRHRRPFDLEATTHDAAPAVPGVVIRTRLEGATRNPAPQPEGLEKLPGISNYFLGNDPTKWRTNVPHYQRVRYPNVYPDIDLVYYGNPQRLEHDFIVAPGADPAAIQLAISGAEQATVNAEGDLVLKVPGGEVVQQAPNIYQVIDGQQQAVAGRYVLRDTAPDTPPTVSVAAAEPAPQPLLVGFEVAQYDRKQPLVIDPVLVYSTYLGGNDIDEGKDIAVDGAGNAYVTGKTWSMNFPIRNAPYPQFAGGLYDAFIVKLNASGTALIYSTYLGGGGSDYGAGIAVDGAGNAYVTGETNSSDFPIRNAPYPNLVGSPDAFIVKLNIDGTALAYSTYLGGTYRDYGYGIAVDSAGNAYVTGETWSTNFPTRSALYPNLRGTWDAFIAKLNASGTALIYSTYLGGNSYDEGWGITVDSAGNAYVTGHTYSTDFPIRNALYPNFRGASDAFIVKLNTGGTALVYSTYLGGDNSDAGYGIAIDGTGNVYVIGETWSDDFPTRNAPYLNHSGRNDAFITKLNAGATALIYSTYLGGSSDDVGFGIAVDGASNAYITGSTRSTDFPTHNAMYPQFRKGIVDAFSAKINAGGTALIYSTYLGGSDHDEGYGVAVGGASNAYVVGYTGSSDFPIHNALYPSYRGHFSDAFITKMADSDGASVTLSVNTTGSGTVYSTPSGINCGSDCTHNYTKGTMLILKALPATGYVFSGWGGACLGVTVDYCTLTMDANKSASAVFKTKTPEKENPQTRYGDGTSICTAPQTGRNAVLITHGWNADAKQWVLLMARDICYKIGSPSIELPASNALKKLCTGGLWDVFVADWSDLACGNIYCATPKQAWNNAPRIGEAVAKKLRSCDYQHLHLIAHSAGSNVIEWVAGIIKTTWENPPTIHQTFLDPYDPAAQAHPTRSGRQNSAYGGNDGKNGKKQWSADWADNYVDLRPIFIEALDKTELYLSAAYNVNVTPAGNCEGADDIDDTCKHGRPYRFYGKSVNPFFFDNFNNHNTVDPITSTTGMGYPLSVEAGWHLADLNQQYGKGKECQVIGSNCQDSPPPSPANKVYVAANASGAVVDRSGIAQCVVGALVIPCSQIGLTTGAVTSAALAESPEAQAADAPTRAPAWLAMQIQTTQPTNTLRFSYRFAAGGEGLLRVFVNENTVREIDQRYVPIASTELESVYVGDLAPGTYKIAFRLDGYGATTSGVTLTGIGLSQQKLVVGIPLAVTKSGTGSGTVTSNPAGINCGTICAAGFTSGATVTLTATAAAGSKFTGWGGVCAGTAPTCTVAMNAAKSVTATFTRLPVLTVTKSGSGAGLITGTGINCGVDCTEIYPLNAAVTLTATAYGGSTFAGWNGCTPVAANPKQCTVAMTASKTVTATFNTTTAGKTALTLYKSGPGLGTVASNPAGINCGTTCNASVAYLTTGASVTLTATPTTGSTFTGWGGACAGTARTCTITMSAARVVTATFIRPVLTVTKAGSGSGLITGTGINCGVDCTESYNLNTIVTLTATAATGSTFVGWSGACTGTGACTVSMTASKTVTATFNTTTAGTYALTLYKIGAGLGTVASNPAGINCGTACVANFTSGRLVTLTATPTTGSTFTGWGGACAGTTPTCTVTMSAARIVTATFTRPVLTVAKAGSGTVTSNPAGINCGADCSEAYNLNASVTLTATPTTGWQFAGWSGSCTGTGTCTVAMSAAKTVIATFKPKLTVSKVGSGTVTSSLAGINCGTTCAAYFPFNGTVTLTATPVVGSTFAGWSGACSGTATTCKVTMNITKSVTATFR